MLHNILSLACYLNTPLSPVYLVRVVVTSQSIVRLLPHWAIFDVTKNRANRATLSVRESTDKFYTNTTSLSPLTHTLLSIESYVCCLLQNCTTGKWGERNRAKAVSMRRQVMSPCCGFRSRQIWHSVAPDQDTINKTYIYSIKFTACWNYQTKIHTQTYTQKEKELGRERQKEARIFWIVQHHN